MVEMDEMPRLDRETRGIFNSGPHSRIHPGVFSQRGDPARILAARSIRARTSRDVASNNVERTERKLKETVGEYTPTRSRRDNDEGEGRGAAVRGRQRGRREEEMVGLFGKVRGFPAGHRGALVARSADGVGVRDDAWAATRRHSGGREGMRTTVERTVR